MIRSAILLSAVFFVVIFSNPTPAYAYLDPGSGSYVIQVLVASLAGIGFLVKTYWSNIKNIFNKSHKVADDKNEKE
ncbi:hypothetical protein ACFL0F_00415 [Patescibacteria group bacterium]